MKETRHSFCRICEQLCGLEIDVDVEKNQVLDIRPDSDHAVGQGHVCIKGTRQHKIYTSADRITAPMKRTGDRWEEITWKQALKEIGSKVKQLRREHGPHSLGMYVGTAAGFSILHPIFAQGFMTGIGSKSLYGSSTQDCANKFAVAREIYGFPFLQPVPDIANTECFIVVGANPAMSKFSFLQLPHPVKKISEIEKRGGKVFWVDPRKTESAKSTGTHIFIKPNTDVYFYLSFLHLVLKDYDIDMDHVNTHMKGFGQLWDICKDWDPGRTSTVTGITPDVLTNLVDTYMNARGAALYCSTGVNMGTHGSLAFWLQEVINAVSGNLDRKGGTRVTKGLVNFPPFAKKSGNLMSRERSRIGNYPAVNDCFPGGIMADEITTPGDNQLRALFVTGGNPLMMMANSGRLKEAFQDLELLVTTDIFINETGSLAHYVLPATDPLQRPDLPFIFPLFLGMQHTPYIQATREVVKPGKDQWDEMKIYTMLASASGVGLMGSRVLQGILRAGMFFDHIPILRRFLGIDQERILSILSRIAGQGSFRGLLKFPHGKRVNQESEPFLGSRVLTDDGLVDLAPPEFVSAARNLEDEFQKEHARNKRLKLITKREIMTMNSWTHNLPEFIEGDRETNYLYMHPDDALHRELEEGDYVDVTSATATVRLPVRLLDDLLPGVVALPHGYGHQHATGLTVASKGKGVNVNILAADGPGELEELSGMAHLTGFTVDVVKAQADADTKSWSGISEKVSAKMRQ